MDSSQPQNYWFPAKRHGWGWGLPTAWQGWAVILVYAAIVGLLIWRVPPRSHPSLFVGSVAIASLLLALVCWLKGEPPSWHWGE
ncbi:MAG: hypothetical protein ACREWJ_14105 [Rhodoferax sp.]